jgi:hypothetical protein
MPRHDFHEVLPKKFVHAWQRWTGAVLLPWVIENLEFAGVVP